MTTDNIPDDYTGLIDTIDAELTLHQATIAAEFGKIAVLDAEQTTLGYHPNRDAYAHGSLAELRGMGAPHILAHAGFYRLAYRDAIARLGDARAETDDDCLIDALANVCERDPMLEVAGFTWLEEHDLLKSGGIDPFWIKRPRLGLGQPAKRNGLLAADAPAHRALYTFTPAQLRQRFDAQAIGEDDTFGDLLPLVIAAGGLELAALGNTTIEADAAEHYWTKCASFAAHQRATGDRRWRWKPPLSRQCHHARTIAELNAIAMPAERTRGHAANWLDDNGANPRFRKD